MKNASADGLCLCLCLNLAFQFLHLWEFALTVYGDVSSELDLLHTQTDEKQQTSQANIYKYLYRTYTQLNKLPRYS